MLTGEWGGWCKEGSPDCTWQQTIVRWFADNDITDSFYWCLNPNSGDTGDCLDLRGCQHAELGYSCTGEAWTQL